MVSSTSQVSSPLTDSLTLSATPAASGASSTNSIDSFGQQLASALESFLNQSGNSSPVEITIQPQAGQNSGASQYLVTLTDVGNSSGGTAASSANGAASAAATPSTPETTPFWIPPAAVAANEAAAARAAASKAATPALATPAAAALAETTTASGSQNVATTASYQGMPITTLQSQIQSMAAGWAELTPQETAFQLSIAGIAGGAAPTATVPGTSMTFGDLNQIQQLAYQYGSDFGTGNLSMQDFLTQNAGPNLPWNLSYNQIQANTDIQAGANAANSPVATANGPVSANNLPNPNSVAGLPLDQQIAAEAALAAEGPYGSNVAAGMAAYTQVLQSV